jgi:hypothetical protein
MIVIYDNLDQKLSELDIGIDEAFHAECLRRLRGGEERRHGLLLYGLVKALAPRCVVDVGTARGYTAVVMAKALEDAGVEGRVFTIDYVGNDQPRDWHVAKQPKADPAWGRLVSRRELLAPFADLVDRRIVFLTGRSRDMIPRIEGKVDFAFIDASPAYKDIVTDIRLLVRRGAEECYLSFDGFDPTNEYWIMPDRLSSVLLTGSFPPRLSDVAVMIGKRLVRRLFSGLPVDVPPRAGGEGIVVKPARVPGITKAVSELARVATRVEVVPLEDETPIWSRKDYGVAVVTLRRSPVILAALGLNGA